jgi:signal transduction histidine kinase
MRRLLGVLREDASAEVAERHPQPGLQQLNELIDEARGASGAGARLIVSGAPAQLDPGVELAAYRIVQEALTNARRHAPGAAVDVELHYGDDTLRLRIRDNGPGLAGYPPATGDAAGNDGGGGGKAIRGRAGRAGLDPNDPSVVAATQGHGLLGMRERAIAAGGQLRTGNAGGSGFVIEATLPTKGETTLPARAETALGTAETAPPANAETTPPANAERSLLAKEDAAASSSGNGRPPALTDGERSGAESGTGR